MNVENKLFRQYESYMRQNSMFIPKVYNDTPQELKSFPTILFLENNNINSSVSTNRIEFVDDLQYKIEIYTRNLVLEGKSYARKTITDELKYLTFKFLSMYNLKRTDVRKGEYLDFNVDRTIILSKCSVNSWNGQIN